MKAMLVTLLALTVTVNSATFTDGRGFFPVMVQVVNSRSGTPVDGVTVRLEGLGDYQEAELDPSQRTRKLPESLGKPVETNDQGVAVVFYHGAWSETTKEGANHYNRSLHGTLVVEHQGKEIFRQTLAQWAKNNNYLPSSSSVPWIVISPPRKAKERSK